MTSRASSSTVRFLSEFYEHYDGWEARYNTHPRVQTPCSRLLPPKLRKVAVDGIDNTSKELYDRTFPYWIWCPQNMAANRQTRALSYIAGNSTKATRHKLCGRIGISKKHASRCDLRLAKLALLQLTFFGLNEERCKTEKLFEAQFGLRFNSNRGARATTASGKGAHKVSKLRWTDLSSAQQQRVREINHNDLQLYQMAVRIFHMRLAHYGIPENVTCAAN